MLTLSDLVRSEGYDFLVDPEPWKREDVVGNPKNPQTFSALLCRDAYGSFIRCVADNLDHAYDCSHEIAEARHGHGHHTAEMFCEQANILAGWVREVSR